MILKAINICMFLLTYFSLISSFGFFFYWLCHNISFIGFPSMNGWLMFSLAYYCDFESCWLLFTSAGTHHSLGIYPDPSTMWISHLIRRTTPPHLPLPHLLLRLQPPAPGNFVVSGGRTTSVEDGFFVSVIQIMCVLHYVGSVWPEFFLGGKQGFIHVAKFL